MTTLAILAAAALGSASPAFVDKPCTDSRLAEVARCGTVWVPENRAAPHGRGIGLNVIVLRSLPGERALPPLFDIDGGPGLPATKNAEFYAGFGKDLRVGREIVLIDQRGTGASNPLNCPELESADDPFRPMLPIEGVKSCRARLEKVADLTRYGTREAVGDIDDVRRALGYDRLDFAALSYGTTVALRYIKAHPQRVRAAVLMGLAPTDARPPRSHAPAAERALRLLFAACEREAACGAAFDPAGDLDRARARLPALAGAPADEVFMEKLRTLMYLPATARFVPLAIYRAAAGDLGPFLALTRSRGPNLYSDGMFLSVTCAEGIALTDLAEARAIARKTPFGDYRLRRQAEACAHWPTAEVDNDHLVAVSAPTAVIMVSGERDPVTPPEWAAEAAARFPNAWDLVLPGSGHIFEGLSGVEDCIDPLIVAFLRSADRNAIDAKCLAAVKPPPFALEMPAAEAR